jgi:hypothetical protein
VYINYLSTLTKAASVSKWLLDFLVCCPHGSFTIRQKKCRPRLHPFGWRIWLRVVLGRCLREITSCVGVFCEGTFTFDCWFGEASSSELMNRKTFVRQCPTWLYVTMPSSAVLNIGTQIRWDCGDTLF